MTAVPPDPGDTAVAAVPFGPSEPAGPAAVEPTEMGPESPAPELPWRRLAPGMLLIEPVRELIRFIPMLVVLIFAGRAGNSGPPWGLIGTVAVIALGISRWLTTRYRITPTLVEVRRGLLQRKHLTVPRDRVRTVDVSAHPLQRLLRLAKVEIGTGTSHEHAEAIKLDGLPAAAAVTLRAELLHRKPALPESVALATVSGDGREAAEPAETILSQLNPRWIKFAPATLSGVVTAAFLIGFAWRIANEAQLNPVQIGAVRRGLDYLEGTALWVDVLWLSALVIVVVTILSVAGYVLSFWNFSLTRHSGGTLQVTRGLLTTRATSIEERRLHGAQRSEPLLLRAVHGARLQAIATGLRQRGSERGSALLVPPAPLSEVLAVEGAVLDSVEIGTATLTQHGPAARRRRYTRALGLTAVCVAALWVLYFLAHWPIAPAAVSLLGVPCAALLARDRYANLGHTVDRGRLVTRVGSLVRRRSTISVAGVIGVTLRQSVFQRRSGLISLTATTAAGSQRYEVPDLTGRAATHLATVLVPAAGAFVDEAPLIGRAASGAPVGRLPTKTDDRSSSAGSSMNGTQFTGSLGRPVAGPAVRQQTPG